MCFADGELKAINCFRDRDEMYVIRHETVCPYFNGALVTPFTHDFQIVLVVVLDEKSGETAVSPLNDMMWFARHDESGFSWHGKNIGEMSSDVQS